MPKKEIGETCPSTTMPKKEIGEDVSQYHYAQKKYTKLTGLELRLGLGGDWQTIDCLSPERVRHGEMNMF